MPAYGSLPRKGTDMHDTSQPHTKFNRPAESFGRIGRRTLSAAALHAITDQVRRWAEQSRQHAQARATWMALRELDARTLRDLGFDHSEILSVAIETGCGLQTTRISREQTLRGSS